MAKTLTVTATIPLPSDHFEAAEILSSVKEPLAAFKAALPGSAVVATEVVTQRNRDPEVKDGLYHPGPIGASRKSRNAPE